MDARPYYAALYSRLQDRLTGDIQRFARRPIVFTRLPAQPALVMAEDSIEPIWSDQGLPPGWTVKAALGLFVTIKDGDEAPGERITALVAKVVEALRWSPSEPFGNGYDTTLDGRVLYARVVGPVEVDESPDGLPQTLTRITVEMEIAPQG